MENQTREYCNNCGNYGHSYANCRHPILSYGIILYNYNESGVPYIVFVGFLAPFSRRLGWK